MSESTISPWTTTIGNGNFETGDWPLCRDLLCCAYSNAMYPITASLTPRLTAWKGPDWSCRQTTLGCRNMSWCQTSATTYGQCPESGYFMIPTTSCVSNFTGNITAPGQTQWEFLLSAVLVLLVSTGVCGAIICMCKAQTREARRKREDDEKEENDKKDMMELQLKTLREEKEKKEAERSEQVQRELEEQEEIEQARKEGREVDPVYNRDDIFYASVGDIPPYVEHPSTYVESGVATLDHKGNPKPRSGDAAASKAKTTDEAIAMVNEKKRNAPSVMGIKVINGVDFYRNQYEKTVAQQEARKAADDADAQRRNTQPYRYRQKKTAAADGIGLGDDFAAQAERLGKTGAEADTYSSAISSLPWIGKQNLSAFDPDAFEKAFADLPDDDEQEEIEKRRLAASADSLQSIHSRPTGQILGDGLGHDATLGGGGGKLFSLLEAPHNRKARDDAETAAKIQDKLERQKFDRAVAKATAEAAALAKKKKKAGENEKDDKAARIVIPTEVPGVQQKKLIIAPHLKLEKDKEKYYAELL